MLPTDASCHDGTEAKAIASLTAQAVEVQRVETGDGREFVVLNGPDGSQRLESITDESDVSPGRLGQRVAITEPASLAEYAKRFTTATGVLFGDVSKGVIAAHLDYHTPSTDGEGGKPEATHNEHRAVLTLQPSEEWRIWTDASGKMMPQIDFARFLEENAVDITAPSGADLLEIARDFHAVRRADFRQIVRTDSDNERLEFTDETTPGSSLGGQMVEVPTTFKIRIPVYFGEPAVEMTARFRWAQAGSELKLGLKLDRVEHVRQAEFRRILTDMAEQTGFPAYFGSAGD